MNQVNDDEFIQYIADYRDEHGFPPSVSDMVDRFGLARSTVQWHIQRMAREGKIRRSPRGARAIAILPPGEALITKGKQITGPLEQL